MIMVGISESHCSEYYFIFIQAANYLGIKALLAVGCKSIANMVRGKPSLEVRTIFNISQDPPGQDLNAPNAMNDDMEKSYTN